MIKSCKKCGIKFDRFNRPKQIFCSRTCGNLFLRKTHGFSHTRFYRIWFRINRVCNKKDFEKYPFYGGRGIKCLWKSFEEFKKDMYAPYQKHFKMYGRLNTTIERIDNNGNYCKENCRWATRKEQARNRRNRVEITFRGKTRSITEWAEHFNIPKVALWLRLYRRHWSIKKAFTTPLR